MKIFERPGDSLRKIVQILFVLLLICGAIMLVSGCTHMLRVINYTGNRFSEFMSYTIVDAAQVGWKADGYAAKTEILNGLYILLSSLATIPLYGFGQLIEDVHALRNRASDPSAVQSEDLPTL